MPSEPRMRGDGEFSLIARLAERLRRASAAAGAEVRVGIGDDAAVTVPRGATVTSTDLLIEGVHFRRETAPPAAIGRKALAAALSDLAAMGAAAGEAYVAVGIPDELSEDDCVALYDGVAGLASDSGTAVLGGDVSRSPVLLLAVTVVGHAPGGSDPVTRAGAAPDHVLAVTGELGGAAAGLLLLERPELESSVVPDIAAALRRRQLEPVPRLEAGAALAAAGASAMIDLSDGIGADAGQIAAASGVRVSIELDRLPVEPGVADVAAAAELDVVELTAAGGEDYELLAAIPADRLADAQSAVSAVGGRLTAIGRTAAGQGVELRDPEGALRRPHGFDHLRDRR
ncbi:MAG: thiamine-phosphate kinase [Solirubrobacterales bacterium]